MRAIPRIAAVVFAAGLLSSGMVPVAHAASLSVDVYGGVTAEYRKTCTNQAPFVCGTYGNVASFTIQTYGQRTPVTVSYQFLSGTAIAGQDFTGPYTGSVTIQPNFPQAWVSVPVVNDGITEPTESLSLRVTSVSQKANIGPPDDTLIFDGATCPWTATRRAPSPVPRSPAPTGRRVSNGGSTPAVIGAPTGSRCGPGSSTSTATR